MGNDLTQRQMERLKQAYPQGARVVVLGMDDPYSPVPAGTKGTVTAVDDLGQIHVDWDTGSTLALIPGVDRFAKDARQRSKEDCR